MSRCLPFSPEALSKRRSSHETLMIKLHKEKEAINTLRKRERVLKKHPKKHGDDKTEKTRQNISPAEMAMSDNSGKSDVTEELTPPTYTSSRIGKVSNRIENPISNKRKRDEESLPDGVESKRMIIRFRLPLKKHSASESTRTAEKNVVLEAEQPIKKPFIKSSEKNQTVQVVAEKPLPIRFGQNKVEAETKNKKVQVEAENPKTEPLAKKAEETVVDAKKHKSRHSKTSKRSSAYKALIEDWVPPSIDYQMACEDDEEDWLFGSRRKQERHEKQDREYCLKSGMWPQATHFPELDLYALPYTVLF